MIIAAAIKYGDLVTFLPAPARHSQISRALWQQVLPPFPGRTDESYHTEVPGFLSDKGEFLDRLQAMTHARECDQLKPRLQPHDPFGAKPRLPHGNELFSDDLW